MLKYPKSINSSDLDVGAINLITLPVCCILSWMFGRMLFFSGSTCLIMYIKKKNGENNLSRCRNLKRQNKHKEFITNHNLF